MRPNATGPLRRRAASRATVESAHSRGAEVSCGSAPSPAWRSMPVWLPPDLPASLRRLRDQMRRPCHNLIPAEIEDSCRRLGHSLLCHACRQLLAVTHGLLAVPKTDRHRCARLPVDHVEHADSAGRVLYLVGNLRGQGDIRIHLLRRDFQPCHSRVHPSTSGCEDHVPCRELSVPGERHGQTTTDTGSAPGVRVSHVLCFLLGLSRGRTVSQPRMQRRDPSQ